METENVSLQAEYRQALQAYQEAIREMDSSEDLIASEAIEYPIRKIFSDHLPAILADNSITEEQKKAAVCISRCKTPALGFNASYCPECGKLYLHYASCNNRNCPCCQYPSQQAWVAQRSEEVIPDIPYYHIILTVPHILNDLILANQRVLLGELFRCSAQAVIDLSRDPRVLGAVPGIISVLHTWSQRLNPHFHIHMIVSGGGLNHMGQFIALQEKRSHHKQKSSSSMNDFFLSMHALTALFRGKMMSSVKRLLESGKLIIPVKDEGRLLDPFERQFFYSSLYETEWVGKIVKTFNGNGNAIEYLARYTFKTAISNGRISKYDGTSVTIRVTDREKQEKKEVTMPALEFVQRFLMHVLPRGFTRVRYFGFLSNAHRTQNLISIHRQRKLKEYKPSVLVGASKRKIFEELFHVDFRRCSHCGSLLIQLPRGRPDC